eukprot:scaffold30687_cov23-Cyclotella_meneghiniana.AAC.1
MEKLSKKSAVKQGTSQSLKQKKSNPTSEEGFASANTSLSCNSTEGGTDRQLNVVTSFEKSTIDRCNADGSGCSNSSD